MFKNKYKKLYQETCEELDKCRVDAKQAKKLLTRREVILTEANDTLEKTNRAKTDFISLAAHQLRSPITTINWYTSSLIKGKDKENLSESQTKKLQQIQLSAKNMAELIDTFLLLSRLELGTSGENHKDIHFQTMMKDIEGDMNFLISQRGIDYATDISVNTKLCTDRNMLKSIIQNLISNALKYTPENGKVRTKITREDQGVSFGGKKIDTDSLCISVEDSGYGIPQKQQERIFERLFRAENVLNRDIQGTGLGLYIVKLMTKQLGGKIWFISEEDKGSTFYVCIPMHLISTC